MTDSNIPVVVESEAKEEAYRMGFERFDSPADNPDDMAFSHYAESAEYANSILPDLRCMAGADDNGYGTYTNHRDVVVVQEPRDRPMDGELTESRFVFNELCESFRKGFYDKHHGNAYDPHL